MATARKEPLVPTLDAEVRSALRAAGAPIQCFGEGPPQRRNRLRIVMSDQQWMDVAALFRACNVEQHPHRPGQKPTASSSDAAGCYSRGPLSLTAFRRDLFQKTVEQAQQRLGKLRMDGITLHQLGANKIETQVQGFVATQLKPMSRRLTVMNVGMDRPGGTAGAGAAVAVAEDDATAAMPHSSTAMRVGFTAVAALPHHDGGTGGGSIVTGDSAGVVSIWNSDTGAPVASRHTHDTGYGRVQGLAAYPMPTAQGTQLIFACARNTPTVTMWSFGPGEGDDDDASPAHLVPHTVPCNELPHRGTFHRLAVDGNGAMLAATSNDCLVRLWDARRLMESAKSQHAGPATLPADSACTPPTFLCALDGLVEARRAMDVSFHPDGSLLSVADGAGRCSSWDLRSGKLCFSTWSAPHIFGPASCVAWSPCGLQFATGGTDHIIQLWDARKLSLTSEVAPLLKIAAHVDYITSLSFMPSTGRGAGGLPTTLVGRPLCSTSLDGSIHFWDTLQAGARLHTVSSSYTEGAVRGHCWTVTPQRGLQLVAITTAHHWSSWSPDASTLLCGGTVVQHDVVVKRHAEQQAVVLKDVNAAEDEQSSDSEDDMRALRNHHRNAAATAPAVLPQDDGDEDDEDDMAQLRRR